MSVVAIGGTKPVERTARPMMRSRNPGANRSIWAVIALVASPV